MTLNTRRLFLRLLRRLNVNCVCDVGSMNGTDALAFRNWAPDAMVVAFEANPRNLRIMQADRRLRDARVDVAPFAVTNFDGEAEFFVVESEPTQHRDARRGMSSLHRRQEDADVRLSPVRVQAVRLDTFLRDQTPSNARLALWIDAEGKAYEVIDGVQQRVDDVLLLHVEVETEPCIAEGQKLYSDVKALLGSAGFVELADDGKGLRPQFNVLFVSNSLPVATWRTVVLELRVAQARYLVTSTLRRVIGRIRSGRSFWSGSRE